MIHCRTLAEAELVLAALRFRMAEVGLELHPDKTRIVYCKDNNRRDQFPVTEFTFLGLRCYEDLGPGSHRIPVRKVMQEWQGNTESSHPSSGPMRSIS